MGFRDKAGPIEVWLTQKNMQITCMIVNEDESTEQVDVQSLSMRGAQRELTGWLIDEGFEPVGRWTDGEHPEETSRRFKVATK